MAAESGSEHSARDLPLGERVDYLTVVASMAAADGRVEESELEQLRAFCRALELPRRETERVLAAARAPDRPHVREILERLKDSPLRFTLLTDLVFVAHADGDFDASELVEVEAIALALGVSEK